MSNTIAFGIARSQDTNIRVLTLAPDAENFDRRYTGLLPIPSPWKQREYWHVPAPWENASVSALCALLPSQSANYEAVPKEYLVPDFRAYMKMVDSWATAFEEEAAPHTAEDIESLYDDAYFEAMELQRRLP